MEEEDATSVRSTEYSIPQHYYFSAMQQDGWLCLPLVIIETGNSTRSIDIPYRLPGAGLLVLLRTCKPLTRTKHKMKGGKVQSGSEFIHSYSVLRTYVVQPLRKSKGPRKFRTPPKVLPTVIQITII
jgi:hypothetical protein